MDSIIAKSILLKQGLKQYRNTILITYFIPMNIFIQRNINLELF